MRKLLILATAFTFGAAIHIAPVQAQAQAAKFLKQFNDWSSYVRDSATNKICFAVSQPKDSEPKKVKRGQIVFYLTTWKQDNVKNQVSVKIGYPFKEGSKVTATIGPESFSLITKDDKAFIEKTGDEARLIEAMKKGAKMIVKGTSKRGTLTTDIYSLSGISAALKHVAKSCS